MADEKARLTLKEALDAWDTPHLQKLITASYDRWNWDTGTDADKDWYEVAEQVLEERGITVVNSPNAPIIFNMTHNGKSIPVITLDGQGDVVIGTTRNLSITDGEMPGSTEHQLFEVNSHNDLQLGWELKRAIVNFIANEMNSPTVTTNSGQHLRTVMDDKTAELIRNRI